MYFVHVQIASSGELLFVWFDSLKWNVGEGYLLGEMLFDQLKIP